MVSFVNTENAFCQFRTGLCSWEKETKHQKLVSHMYIEHVLNDHRFPLKVDSFVFPSYDEVSQFQQDRSAN